LHRLQGWVIVVLPLRESHNIMSENNQNNEWQKREVGAFWKNKGRNSGQTYLSGHVSLEDEATGAKTRIKLVVFPNKYKDQNEKAPDFHVYLSKDSESTASNSGNAAPQQTQTQEEEVLM